MTWSISSYVEKSSPLDVKPPKFRASQLKNFSKHFLSENNKSIDDLYLLEIEWIRVWQIPAPIEVLPILAPFETVHQAWQVKAKHRLGVRIG